ncbi:uncharacterized protein MONBRDRAFT_9447 [Monosiga brevicollis MX1]|uniref:Protein kinase domain-containing protein n=1 Tax=Monosiga brevicollis TaxID=81824 RepID=A9V367_MONBE|nr:uncharacterized protein MONBRDRAFT_9447 [Monosiga brevicollis MX1]EDQ88008.1 predicted protein [Monosiga brevicollis MX1]|eukprot:XP_001747084.1 hypothetical protein [Monosiga brevicollis MX1]
MAAIPAADTALQLGNILHNRYRLLDRLGAGASGTVFCVLDLETDRHLALKVAVGYPFGGAHEAEALQRCQGSPHIAHLLDHFPLDKLGHALVLPIMAGGTLFDHIRPTAARPLTIEASRRWMRQLLLAADALACQGLVHGDIKPENCLIDAEGNLFLHDFGTTVPSGYRYPSRIAGTQLYMSPDLLQGGACSSAQDAWAVGLTWYATLFADLPWDRASQRDPAYVRYLATGKLPVGDRLQLLSPDLRVLLLRLLHPNPNLRATLSDALAFVLSNRPWFQSECNTDSFSTYGAQVLQAAAAAVAALQTPTLVTPQPHYGPPQRRLSNPNQNGDCVSAESTTPPPASQGTDQDAAIPPHPLNHHVHQNEASCFSHTSPATHYQPCHRRYSDLEDMDDNLDDGAGASDPMESDDGLHSNSCYRINRRSTHFVQQLSGLIDQDAPYY